MEALLGALQLAAHPEDGAARFAVATSPLAQALGVDNASDRRRAVRLAGELSRRVFEEGLARTVEFLATVAADQANQRGRERLSDVIAQAEAYESEPPEHPSIDDFIRCTRAARVRPRGEGVVRVLTLHGAKGLQFDQVFLADIDGTLAKRVPAIFAAAGEPSSEPLGHDADPTADPTRLSLAGSSTIREHSGVLSAMAADWRARAVYEELCLLYVGMTRAKTVLEGFARPSKRGLGSIAWSGLVAGEVSDGATEIRRAAVDRSPSSPSEAQPSNRLAHAIPAWAEPAQNAQPKHGPEAPWRVAVLSPSGVGSTATVRSRLGTDMPQADLGVAVHRVLESVEWLETDGDDPAQWIDLSTPMDLEAASRITAALKSGGLPTALSRDRITSRWRGELELTVLREHEIAVPVEYEGRTVLVRGRSDRLVVGHSDGQVRRCLITDFKTGRPGAQAFEQLELYRRAVAAMYQISIEDVDGELVEV